MDENSSVVPPSLISKRLTRLILVNAHSLSG